MPRWDAASASWWVDDAAGADVDDSAGVTFSLGIQPVELKPGARTIVRAGPAQRQFYPKRIIIPSGSGAVIHAIRAAGGENALVGDIPAAMFAETAVGLGDLDLPPVPVGGCLEFEVSTMKIGETFQGALMGAVGPSPERDLLVEEAEKKVRDIEGEDG